MHKDKFMTIWRIFNFLHPRAKTIIFVNELRHADSCELERAGCIFHDLPENAVFCRRCIPKSSCAILMHFRRRLSQTCQRVYMSDCFWSKYCLSAAKKSRATMCLLHALLFVLLLEIASQLNDPISLTSAPVDHPMIAWKQSELFFWRLDVTFPQCLVLRVSGLARG